MSLLTLDGDDVGFFVDAATGFVGDEVGGEVKLLKQ